MHRGGPRAPVHQGHRGHREGVHRRLQVVEVEMDMDNLLMRCGDLSSKGFGVG